MTVLTEQVKQLLDGYVDTFGVKPNRVRMRAETYQQLLDETLSGMEASLQDVQLRIVKVHGLTVRVVKTMGVGEFKVDNSRRPGASTFQVVTNFGQRGK